MPWFDPYRLQSRRLTTDHQPFSLVQISDCHLLINGGTYHGVDTKKTLTAVLDRVRQIQPDCVVVTGDITQDHTMGSYAILADLCRDYLGDTPIAWLPGNHDEIEPLQESFSESPFIAQKQLIVGDWVILLLNSKGPTPAGLISQRQLQQLTEVLQQLKPTQSVAVFCHHHLLPVNGYIDQHIMQNGEELLVLLKQFDQLKCISHGHVHQQHHRLIEGNKQPFHLWATPSTSIQFKVRCDTLIADDKGPAFRCFQFNPDGKVTSEVIGLD
jgi:Icc protein